MRKSSGLIYNIKNCIINYGKKNSKEYIIVILIFIIGIFLGVMFINNASQDKEELISNYITTFIDKFKNMEKINNYTLAIDSIKNNFILTIIIWAAGTTIIGMPIVLGIILFRGFCLGYTISALNFALGSKSGFIFCFSSLFLQNLLFIPAVITMGVSSIKLYKSIISDRRKENIKIEIIRHTIIIIIMLIVLIVSCLIESAISIKLLRFNIKFIKSV